VAEDGPVGAVELGVDGVRVGHWSDPVARTGCTVVVLPPGTVASGEVRGGAPATREFALLDPGRTVAAVDAVVLTGGSAFGLASADGVVAGLAADGRGFETRSAHVPIVVAMAVYDLGEGDASVRPDAAAGLAAYRAAAEGPVSLGRVGGGTGATVGKWRGAEATRPGGLGGASARLGDLVVGCLVVVNAVGDVGPGPDPLGSGRPTPELEALAAYGLTEPLGGEATTVAVVVTNARLDKAGCCLVAEGAHDGFARAIFPVHTRADGDAVVAAATGDVAAPVDRVRALAVLVVERAIRSVASIPG
jgi:L-aminopeptidase/D-esterase-like protein